MRIKYIKSSDKRAKEFNEFIESKYPHILSTKQPELILIAGGDGAMMHAIRKYNEMDIPFFGVAKGTFNFLMNEIKNEGSFLEKLLSGKIKMFFQETQTIQVTHKGK
ncbi:MAG: NAD(+)/NADH kinase, partial [Enhygromyxa sp.]